MASLSYKICAVLTFVLFTAGAAQPDGITSRPNRPNENASVTSRPLARFHSLPDYEPLPAHAVGLLISHVGRVNDHPQVSADDYPAEHIYFAAGNGSYRRVLWHCEDPAKAISVTVPVDKNGAKKSFTKVCEATVTSAQVFGIVSSITLVEVEVNGGAGSPPSDSFVATSVKVLGIDMPNKLNLEAVRRDAEDQFKAFENSEKQALEQRLPDVAARVLGDAKSTEPRKFESFVHITWLPIEHRVQFTFDFLLKDGSFHSGSGLGNMPSNMTSEQMARLEASSKVKQGTEFGVETGLVLEYSQQGDLMRHSKLPLSDFSKAVGQPN